LTAERIFLEAAISYTSKDLLDEPIIENDCTSKYNSRGQPSGGREFSIALGNTLILEVGEV